MAEIRRRPVAPNAADSQPAQPQAAAPPAAAAPAAPRLDGAAESAWQVLLVAVAVAIASPAAR